MKLKINEQEYSFVFNGFGPLYAYEVIMGEPFEGSSTRNIHVMIYATLLASNPQAPKLSLDVFTRWLYDHPAEEKAMASVVLDEFLRRAELAKKKE